MKICDNNYRESQSIHGRLDIVLNHYISFQSVKQMHPPGQSIVAFRPNKDRSAEEDEVFKGNLQT